MPEAGPVASWRLDVPHEQGRFVLGGGADDLQDEPTPPAADGTRPVGVCAARAGTLLA